MAKLYFRYSAMGAGKSLDLLKVAYNYEERGMKALLFNSKVDTRFAGGYVASRTGLKKEAILFDSSTNFLNIFNDNKNTNCLLVDEAQFLKKSQVSELRTIVNKHKIPIICYGLRTDFQTNLFEGSKWLLAWADTIEELKTVCWCGKKATVNARINNDIVTKSGEQIQIGGNESYVALCWNHYESGQLK